MSILGKIGTIAGNARDTILGYPILTLGVVGAALDVAVSFGLGLSVQQTGLILGLAAAVLSLIGHSQVTPTSRPTLTQGTVVTVVTPPGQPNESVTL